MAVFFYRPHLQRALLLKIKLLVARTSGVFPKRVGVYQGFSSLGDGGTRSDLLADYFISDHLDSRR